MLANSIQKKINTKMSSLSTKQILTHQVTIPYGGFLILGGLIGLIVSGSLTSLMFGGTIGSLLMALGYLSMKDYEENSKQNQFKSATYSYCVMSLVLSIVVTLVMGERFMETGKVMPPGIVAFVSLAMCMFYVWKLASDDVGAHAKRARY
jgi:uncharacterized membrane protein (UPF0136 family)